MALRIVFFGLPLAALLLARDGHDVALAALSRTDAVGLRRARRLFGPDRLLIKPKVSETTTVPRQVSAYGTRPRRGSSRKTPADTSITTTPAASIHHAAIRFAGYQTSGSSSVRFTRSP